MAELYDIADYDSDEEREKYPEISELNLYSAASFIVDLFQRNDIQYAVMGGFACLLLQSERQTRDLDIAFQAPNKMRSIWNAIERESRLKIPKSRMVESILKIFVKTGPGFDHCIDRIDVEVDLIENGSLGSPIDLTQHRRSVTLDTISGQKTFQTLDILYMLRSKMGAYAARRTGRDRDDIQFLLGAYPDEARGAKSYLDPDNLQTFLSGLSSANKRRWTEFLNVS